MNYRVETFKLKNKDRKKRNWIGSLDRKNRLVGYYQFEKTSLDTKNKRVGYWFWQKVLDIKYIVSLDIGWIRQHWIKIMLGLDIGLFRKYRI